MGLKIFFRQHGNIDGRLLIIFTIKMPFRVDSGSRAIEGPINLDDLPRFVYQRADLWTNASRALPDLQLLLLLNCAAVPCELSRFSSGRKFKDISVLVVGKPFIARRP